MIKRLDQLLDPVRPFVDEQIAARYRDLPPREQRLVMFFSLFLAIVIPLFTVVIPLADERSTMVENMNVLKLQAAEASIIADKLQRVGKSPERGNIMSEVDRIARESGVRKFMTRIRPQVAVGGSKNLMVQMKNAPYRKIVSFVSTLTDRGLGFSRMKLQAAENPGRVHLQAVITGG